MNGEVLWGRDSSPAIYRPISAKWCRRTTGGTETARAHRTGCQDGKKWRWVMWIYSQQSHWLNVITVTLMETAGSLHENVTELRNRNVTKLDLWLWAGARALNGNDLPTTIIIWTWCSDVETMQCVFHCVHPCVCVCVDAELYAPKWADVSTIFSWWTVSAVIASVIFPRDNIWIIPFRHQTVTDVFNNELGRCVYDCLWVKFQSVFQNL